jgi:hypothetical protein
MAASDPATMRSGRYVLQLALFVVLLLPGFDEAQYFVSHKWFITDWNDYVAPIILKLSGMDRDVLMLIAGLVQLVVAGLIVIRPRAGATAACAGFCLIIINLLLHSAYDIVIRDFGLLMAAAALALDARRPLRRVEQLNRMES